MRSGAAPSCSGAQAVSSGAWGGTFTPRIGGVCWDEGDRTRQANPEVAAHSGVAQEGVPRILLGLRRRDVAEWAANRRGGDHGVDKGRAGGDSGPQEGPVRSRSIYLPRLGGARRSWGLG